MSKGQSRAPSQRQLRVGEELRHVLANVMERRELHDPRLATVDVTVTEVRVSPDLKNATAFIATLGSDEAEETAAALTHAAPFLRRRLAEQVRMRHTPQLRFEVDRSFENAERIDALLQRVGREKDGA